MDGAVIFGNCGNIYEKKRIKTEENTMFNEKSIVIKAAVISDAHISYTEYSADDIVE